MGNKTDVVVKLVLVFFVSLLSFSIGTYVGRKYSDNQHKMAQLEPGSSTQTTREVASEGVSESAPAATNAKKESLTDDEIAKLAEEFVADDTAEKSEGLTATAGKNDFQPLSAEPGKKTETHAATAVKGEAHHAEAKAETHHAEAAVAKTEAHKEVAPPAEAPMKVAQQIAAGHTPAIEKVALKKEIKEYDPARIPSSIPKDVAQYSVGKFTVQIASFASQEEADHRSHELQEKGYKAFIIPAQIKGKAWFRVSVGLFATEKEAKDYKTEFMAKAKVDNAIVQKISK